MAHNWDHLRAGDFGGAIAAFAFARCPIDLDELGEVTAVMQRGGNRGTVRLEAVRGHLKVLMSGRLAQAFDENVRGGLVAAAQSEVKNEFGISFDGNETVGVPNAAIVRFLGALVAFLLLHEAPNLIALNIFHRHVHDQAARDGGALFTGQRQQLHDGVAVQVRDPLGTADGVAFDQQAKSEYDPILGNVASGQGGFVGFGVGLFAERAAKAAWNATDPFGNRTSWPTTGAPSCAEPAVTVWLLPETIPNLSGPVGGATTESPDPPHAAASTNPTNANRFITPSPRLPEYALPVTLAHLFPFGRRVRSPGRFQVPRGLHSPFIARSRSR